MIFSIYLTGCIVSLIVLICMYMETPKDIRIEMPAVAIMIGIVSLFSWLFIVFMIMDILIDYIQDFLE